MDLKQLTTWFTIDAMWGRDFNIELNRIGMNSTLISSGLGLFEYIATRAIYGIQQENTLDAAIGNLLLYEDIIYMEDISSLYRVDLRNELNYMDSFRQTNWQNTPLLPKIMPNMIQELPYSENEEVKVIVCPPFTSLETVNTLIKDTNIGLGGQNMCAADSGAFTGGQGAWGRDSCSARRDAGRAGAARHQQGGYRGWMRYTQPPGPDIGRGRSTCKRQGRGP